MPKRSEESKSGWKSYQDLNDVVIRNPNAVAENQTKELADKPKVKHVGGRATYDEDGNIVVKTSTITKEDGLRISKIRNRLGMKQKEFALKFQIPENDLSELEAGRGKLTPAVSRIMNFVRQEEKKVVESTTK